MSHWTPEEQEHIRQLLEKSAEFANRAKTNAFLRDRIDKATEPAAKRGLRARLASLMAEGPEGCECSVCVRNWEEHG